MPLNPRFAEPRVEWRDSHAEHEPNPALAAVKSGSGKATMALIGRLLLAAIFLMSGIAKLTDVPGTVAHMTKVGIPYADTLALIAGTAEILGAASLILGLLTRIGALGLFVYMIPTTLLFHAFWNHEGAERMTQMVNFMKNLAIMGGLATLVGVGALLFSVDHRIRRRHHRSLE